MSQAHKSRTLIIIFITCSCALFAQSDVVPKGSDGFEVNYGQAFVEGQNSHLGYLGGSINGRLDLGVGIVSNAGVTPFIFNGAFHFGGELNDMGVALGVGYVVFPEVKNYFVLGPSFYANQEIGDVSIIPSVDLEFATQEVFQYGAAFGLSIITKGQVAIAFRPKYFFSPDQSYFVVTFGFIARS